MANQTDTGEAGQLQRRNRELSILNAVAQTLNRQTDLTQALQAALSQVAELLGLRTGWVWLLREDSGESYLAADQNLPPGLAADPRKMEGSCYCLDTYRAGDLAGAANVNVVTCSRLKGLVDGTAGLRYHASIPLYAHGKKLGVMNVASTDWRELSADDLRLLYTIGDMLGIAVERARLFERSLELGALEERNRLAREIHDTLAQGLSAITMQLETADVHLEGQPAEGARRAVQEALKLARENLVEARRSVLDLRAATLGGRSLPEALADLLAEYESRWRLQTKLEVFGASRPLPAGIEAGLYRMAQEALANVVRHARARSASVTLTLAPNQVSLVVEDDGMGFDVGRPAAGGYGLIGLNERAHLLGGRLAVKSGPGAGTRLEVVVPLNP
jgi:two-component system NarL family sensor kinase